MLYFLTAAALLAHTVFWGAGLAWLTTPRRWRMVAWAFAPTYGLALQSAVVWVGVHTTLAGTSRYAWASELLPLLLLVIAWRCRPLPRLPAWRKSLSLGGVLVCSGFMLLAPMGNAGRGLSSVSLGSLDHADYAAGARVFQEFSSADRTGFLGLPEVTKVRSADYFFDYYVRLNHFTPSALIAHNGAILGLVPYQLVSVSAAVAALLNLAPVMLALRVFGGLRGVWLLAGLLLFALNPVQVYAVHHGALGQLYALHGITIITLAVYALLRDSGGRWGMVGKLPLGLAAVWLLAGAYNFILLIAFAPAAALSLGAGIFRRDWRMITRPVLFLGACLALAALFFWGRFDGLAERFSLFEQYNFGWPVPLLSPEGWLGMVRTLDLEGLPSAWRWAICVVLAGVVLVDARRQFIRVRGFCCILGPALLVPVLAGWGILAVESATRANASYDAFKLVSVFHGLTLAVLLGAVLRCAHQPRWLGAANLTILLLLEVRVAAAFHSRMSLPILRVDRALRDLQVVERNSDVQSINMRVDDFWRRLWANYFLLRKPQFFLTHSYEGRKDTPLRGEWDLRDTVLRSLPPASGDYIPINSRFHLVRAGTADRLGLEFGEGWHQFEVTGAESWRWAGKEARLKLVNETGRVLCVRLFADLQTAGESPIALLFNGRKVGDLSARKVRGRVDLGIFQVEPGTQTLAFVTTEPVRVPGDPRELSLALYQLDAVVQPNPETR